MWAVATSSSFSMSAESNTVMCIGATYYKNIATTTTAAAAILLLLHLHLHLVIL